MMAGPIAMLLQLFCQWETMDLEGKNKAQPLTMTIPNFFKWCCSRKEAEEPPSVTKKALRKLSYK
jgi:hypothetical protein